MKKLLPSIKLSAIAAISALFVPFAAISQIDLGSASDFAIFSSAGAVTNTGFTRITGNIGAQTDGISGFEPPSIITGNIYNADAITAQCSIDLVSACTQLDNTAVTSADHLALFGNGETLLPGVYSIGTAGSISGTLVLDGNGHAGAIFIFKIGGVLTIDPSVTIILMNGATPGNVYWKSTGATNIGAGVGMKGVVIANGAISMAPGGTLEGRLLSTAGAVDLHDAQVYLPAEVILPIALTDFKALLVYPAVSLRWITAGEVAVKKYEAERSADGHQFLKIGAILVTNTSGIKNYQWQDNNPLQGISFYRLKIIDADATFSYSPVSKIRVITKQDISVFPNPVTGHVMQLRMYGQPTGIYTINVYNLSGKKVVHTRINYNGNDPLQTINLNKNLLQGIYYLKVHDPENSDKTLKIFIE